MTKEVFKSSRFNADSIFCEDLQKPQGPILTGVGFLDHMLDQFNSHAQIGVSLTVADFSGENSDMQERNRHATHDQAKLRRLVGMKLGTELQRLLLASSTTGKASRFCCPLDEALVACELKYDNSSQEITTGKLVTFSLTPYGKFPPTGRKYIGSMETDKLQIFWESLAEHSGLEISLEKIRGDNAHHIVESTFKSFSRAIRNLLDGINTTTTGDANRMFQLYGPESDNCKASIDLSRQASVQRSTKETSISTTIRMDGGISGSEIDTGIQTLDQFLSTLASNASMSLSVNCKGDLWIDDHHTAEDVSISLGQVLTEALGTKAGLNRMWSAVAQSGDAKVEVTMDLSNRPCFTHNLALSNSEADEKVGNLSLEMFEHVLDSLVVNSRTTVHVVQMVPSSNLGDTIQAVGIAFGVALKHCATVDCRRAGATASSKGTLSV
jgi:imidazoleglycerol-phosphate dehydratase